MQARLDEGRQASPEAAITPDMRLVLTEIVKNKTAPLGLSAEQRKGWNASLFNKLARHFGISSYVKLPQKSLPEAVDFLLNLEVAPVSGNKAVQGKMELPEDMRINRKLALENLEKLVKEINTAFKAIEDMVQFGCHPGKSKPYPGLTEKTSYNILMDMYSATIDSIQAAQRSLQAGYRFGVMCGRE